MVAVIAVLVAVAIPTFGSQLEKSRQAVDISNLRGAYAAARIAEMDGAFIGNDGTRTAIAAGTEYYYDPDTGNLLATKPDTLKTGKATSALIVADKSGLADKIKYGTYKRVMHGSMPGGDWSAFDTSDSNYAIVAKETGSDAKLPDIKGKAIVVAFDKNGKLAAVYFEGCVGNGDADA